MAEESESEAPSDELPLGDDGPAWGVLAAASREKADTFLTEQTRFVQYQHKLLRAEHPARHHLLHAQRASALMKVAFEVLAAVVITALVSAAVYRVWMDAHDTGLVIEPFQVPPDMANRGLSGQVIASKVLDKLSAMQAATVTARPAQSFANDWGDDFNVVIPDTGISLGQVDRYLRETLGQETHITGEIYRSPTGVVVTARANGNGGAPINGDEADLDTLLQQAAENIYERTQPYRYAIYLINNPGMLSYEQRWTQARQIFAKLTTSPDPQERAWAWVGLGNAARYLDGNIRAADWCFRRALAEVPGLAIAYYQLASNDRSLGHDEAVLDSAHAFVDKISGGAPGLTPQAAIRYGYQTEALADQLLGDYAAAIQADQKGADASGFGSNSAEQFRERVYEDLGGLHDAGGVRAVMQQMPELQERDLATRADRLIAQFAAEVRLGHWKDVISHEPAVEQAQLKFYRHNDNRTIVATQYRVWLALAEAETGDVRAADAAIRDTPTDCYACLRVRGIVAFKAGRWGAATSWFGKAIAQGPSLPQAYLDWGQALMSRHDDAGAAGLFASAAEKAPHFADPLEMDGEALMLENKTDDALAQFAAANEIAPHWGRLHLKWGEAFQAAGRAAEARAQFAQAARLDLNDAERAELASVAGKSRA